MRLIGLGMLLKLGQILIYAVASFGIAFVLYPWYIQWLRRVKIGKTIREESVTGDKAEIFARMHSHKAGTPNIGGGLFVAVVLVMIIASLALQNIEIINNSLINREETYLLLFAFF
jgi:UDP-N-acetylmuramyl pentapeptide phosphotransferase/UDP-N-acetylglucosamine-1-phosphate transferase